MIKAIHLFFTAALALHCLGADAGDLRTSSTDVSGEDLFFAWLPAAEPEQSYVSFNATGQLDALRRQCEAGRAIHELIRGGRYHCKPLLGKAAPGAQDSESPIIEIVGRNTTSDVSQLGLFSKKAVPHIEWQRRRLSLEEVQSLPRNLSVPANVKAAWIVEGHPRGAQILVLPGKLIKDEGAFYEARYHHVFAKQGDVYRYRGRVLGNIEHWVDVDGDGFPELVVSESCDGLCITLWRLDNGLQKLADFGGH